MVKEDRMGQAEVALGMPGGVQRTQEEWALIGFERSILER